MLKSPRVLIQAVEQARPGFGEMKSDAQKAEVFNEHLLRLMHPEALQLLVRVPNNRCPLAAARYALTEAEAFPLYCVDAFRETSPRLGSLIGSEADMEEVWTLLAHALSKQTKYWTAQVGQRDGGGLTQGVDYAGGRGGMSQSTEDGRRRAATPSPIGPGGRRHQRRGSSRPRGGV